MLWTLEPGLSDLLNHVRRPVYNYVEVSLDPLVSIVMSLLRNVTL